MKPNNNKEAMLEVMNRLINMDTKERGLSANDRCIYHGKDEEGKVTNCIVGKFLADGIAEEWELVECTIHDDTSVTNIVISREIKGYNKEDDFQEGFGDITNGFWCDIQGVHDVNRYWGESGLNREGIELIRVLKERYINK